MGWAFLGASACDGAQDRQQDHGKQHKNEIFLHGGDPLESVWFQQVSPLSLEIRARQGTKINENTLPEFRPDFLRHSEQVALERQHELDQIVDLLRTQVVENAVSETVLSLNNQLFDGRVAAVVAIGSRSSNFHKDGGGKLVRRLIQFINGVHWPFAVRAMY